jgi:N utilization substance protein B
MDMIIMKMALAELTSFPSIPVKVTINEYIEISKAYSSIKSKFFINGILDKLVIKMKEEGTIMKTGRGLIE